MPPVVERGIILKCTMNVTREGYRNNEVKICATKKEWCYYCVAQNSTKATHPLTHSLTHISHIYSQKGTFKLFGHFCSAFTKRLCYIQSLRDIVVINIWCVLLTIDLVCVGDCVMYWATVRHHFNELRPGEGFLVVLFVMELRLLVARQTSS